jgi:hypothetical protein
MPVGFQPPQQQQSQPNLPSTPARQYVRASIPFKNDDSSNTSTEITQTLHTVHLRHRAHRHTHQQFRDKLAGHTKRLQLLQASRRRARTITVFRTLVSSLTNAPYPLVRQIEIRGDSCQEVEGQRSKVTTTKTWAILQQTCTTKRSIRVCLTLYYFDTSQIL